LRFDGLVDQRLVLFVLRLVLLRDAAQRFMLVAGLGESGDGLAHVGDARLGGGSSFGADEQALLPDLVFGDAGDVAQAQLAVGVVAFELGLDFGFGVVQDQVVAAASCAVAAAGHEFAASEAREGLLVWQAPGGHVHGVVNAAGDDGAVRVTAQEIHNHFLADAGGVHGPQLVACPCAAHAHPARAVLVFRAITVPRKLHFDAAQRVVRFQLHLACLSALLASAIVLKLFGLPRQVVSWLNINLPIASLANRTKNVMGNKSGFSISAAHMGPLLQRQVLSW
jgi:hypothetical protein